MRPRVFMLALLAVLAGGASVARADGDPGSDVLVYQRLFLTADAGVSVPEQVQLGGLLQAAGRAAFPVRVAIVASRSDLGAVTGLWRRPRDYARFLGIELSLAYKGRLLVVMPDGLGFNWVGHPSAPGYRVLAGIRIGPGGAGLAAAAESAVRALAGAAHVKLPSPAQLPSPARRGATGPARAAAGHSTPGLAPRGSDNNSAALILALLAAAGVAALGLRHALRRRKPTRRLRPSGTVGRSPASRTRLLAPRVSSLAALVVLAAAVPVIALSLAGGSTSAHSDALAGNPHLDPGTALSGAAPDFTLSDELGRPVSLRSFRGKVVILAFNDSECTTICPLTTSAMLDARAMLGSAGARVQLLGIDANPKATALGDVLSYSQLHGLLHRWRFLTGSLSQLERVWKAYSIGVEINRRQIDHTPAVFVIDTRGRLAKLYVTQQSYSAVEQFGQVLAREAARLLPDRPRVSSNLSYAPVSAVPPTRRVDIPRAGGGTIALGPGDAPRLFLFFATWTRETTSLAGELEALNRYQAAAPRAGSPGLTAVDEASVEPTPAALPTFLRGLPRRLSYPVGVDQSGQVADGYGVQGQPWFVLTSAAGEILWYWQVSASGWPSPAGLARHIREALARGPRAPRSLAAAAQQLAGSPAPLASLHRQASELLGSAPALAARIRGLRGYPIVINAWASWCGPCRSEFALFAAASAQYGRRVAFLGADTSDSSGDARAFLAQHPVAYPSFQTTTGDLRSLAVIEGLPTTIFINRRGRVAYVHTGQYDSQGTLDGDVASYALPG